MRARDLLQNVSCSLNYIPSYDDGHGNEEERRYEEKRNPRTEEEKKKKEKNIGNSTKNEENLEITLCVIEILSFSSFTLQLSVPAEDDFGK